MAKLASRQQSMRAHCGVLGSLVGCDQTTPPYYTVYITCDKTAKCVVMGGVVGRAPTYSPLPLHHLEL